MSETNAELEEARRTAEEHAFSVRQLIGQRTRLTQLFRAISSVTKFKDDAPVAAVLSAIEATPSQFYQDIYCQLLNFGKREGFFVEFGACDGVLISNTLILEKEFGWKGILAEPMPSWHAALEKNRVCAIDKRCVWMESGKYIDFVEFEGDEYKTESSANDKNVPRNKKISSAYKVETVTLRDLLRQHCAPREIDFISMDVEGAEYDILSGFDFDEYQFGFICVEQHGETAENIRRLLNTKGYKQVFEEASGHDGFYVPNADE